MKLLLINYEYPPLGGGAGNATKNLAKELTKLGHEIMVLTTWFEGLHEEEQTDGFRIIRVKSLRQRKDRSSLLEMLSFVQKAKSKAHEILKTFKPDHVVSFFALPTGLVAYSLYKKYSIPYTLSLRGGDVPGFLPEQLWKFHLISKPFTWLVWKNAHTIVANSVELKVLGEKTASKYKKNVAYIPNGVDHEFFTPDSAKHSAETFYVLCVGRLVEQKRFDSVIDAVANIKDRNMTLGIIGDGLERKKWEKLTAEKGITSKVTFLGWIDKHTLLGEYQKADLFILPSLEEGMPNVVLEAMACAVPIIATDVPGNHELLSEGAGILIGDVSEIKERIENVYDDKALKTKLSEVAHARAKAFSWMNSAQKYINIIQ